MSAHLGIDLGTSAVKVLALADDGRVLSRGRASYRISTPRPGWAEQDPADWWRATTEAVRQTVAACPAPIASVGLSGQLNSFVLLDGKGHPLGPSILWLDLRGADEAAELRSAIQAAGLSHGPNPVSAIAVLPKLVWLGRNDAQRLRQAKTLLLSKDWIRWRLTGAFATDPSDAVSTALATEDGRAWDSDLVEMAGINPDLLPPIHEATEIAGRLTATAAAELGLATGIPVAVGAGDVTALAVGCGVTKAGRVAITLGTAGHVVVEAPYRAPPRNRALWSLPHARAGIDLWLGLVMAGGLSLDWVRRIVGMEFDAALDLAAQAPAGAEGITFLPFLEGAASPYDRADLRGAFHGLSSAHGPGALVRAVLEGVAFNVAACVDAFVSGGAELTEVRLAEGGAQSDLWCQIMADALRLPVGRIEERDTSALGAALMGNAAVARVNLADIAEASVTVTTRFEPNTSAEFETARAAYDAAVPRLF